MLPREQVTLKTPTDIDTSFCKDNFPTEAEQEQENDGKCPEGSTYIFYWSCHSILLQCYLTCNALVLIQK